MELGRGEVDSVRVRLIAARPQSHDAPQNQLPFGKARRDVERRPPTTAAHAPDDRIDEPVCIQGMSSRWLLRTT
jgi:hypothetical protein